MKSRKGNGSGRLPDVHAGFIPLVDCATLAIARELGFDRRNGIALRLHRDVSWANIRDKVNVGALDCAHMLAPMPIASSLGVGHVRVPVIAPMSLGLNGNAITVSRSLFTHMLDMDAENARAGGMAAGKALAKVVAERRQRGAEPLTLGMVYPFSCHNYELRYWLAAAGIDPDLDVQLVVIPPPLMADSLKAGQIHGFCVGEPWNSLAVELGAGVIVATKTELWRNSPEKVLGMRLSWAEDNAETMIALVRALVDAAIWLDIPGNRAEAAAILSREEYLNLPVEILARSLTGTVLRGPGMRSLPDEGFFVFHDQDATVPHHSHAVWLVSQMIRWGQIAGDFNIASLASRVFREDLYRRAIPSEGQAPRAPTAIARSAFFGGENFEPEKVLDYIRGFSIHSPALDIKALEAANS
ncbi:MAG: CmpA/NrtA family ABC transporter substrate-binding protein [Pseudomonadota bacterium]|nr:CmpA/NrtA family ABC transporter substrate-binding protein [Pseudomonadota bacterium]